MGIPYHAAYLVGELIAKESDVESKQILTLGVQDCQFTLEGITSYFARLGLPYRDQVAVQPTTNVRALRGDPGWSNFIHQRTFFALLGFRPDNVRSLDQGAYEQPDIIHDLNEPVGPDCAERYDYVFDGGTIEHIFDIAAAFRNISTMLRPGGLAIHLSPLDMMNHGFYNLTPELLRAFYLSNGFSEVTVRIATVPMEDTGRRDHYVLVNPPDRFWYSLNPFYRSEVFAAFRKERETTSFIVPTQGKYVELWSRPGGPSPAPSPAPSRLGRLSFLITRWLYLSPTLFTVFKLYLFRRKSKRIVRSPH